MSINQLKIRNNSAKSLLMTISAASAVNLFFQLSLPANLLIFAAMYFVVIRFPLSDWRDACDISQSYVHTGAALMTLGLIFSGFNSFVETRILSEQIEKLAKILHLQPFVLVQCIALVCCGIGIYATYIVLCRIIVIISQLLNEVDFERNRRTIIANLKSNWWFPVSAIAFFTLCPMNDIVSYVSLLIAGVLITFFASQVSSIWNALSKYSIALKLWSLFCALGICLAAHESFCLYYIPSFRVFWCGVFKAVTAIFFVYCCVLIFWNKMKEIFAETKIFKDVKDIEWVVYIFLFVFSLVWMIISFRQTDAFYGTEYKWDIIYTSDTPIIVKDNAYMILKHTENDLRQPLFAVFTAPFVGAAYLIGRVLRVSDDVEAMLLNSVQIFMLLLANFMMTRTMKLNCIRRICFMVLSCCTYSYMLFILMMEQYIVVYFWLMLLVYYTSENKSPDPIVLWGAGGTLITNLILLPFASDKASLKNYEAWLKDIVKLGLGFTGMILIFCRFDIIYSLKERLRFYKSFDGEGLTFVDKLCQYSGFVSGCFIAPEAEVNVIDMGHFSWQLSHITTINIIGLSILVLAVISIILNRNKRSALLAAGWMCFSMVMLVGLGWGTNENGLILYSIYFGWEFFLLLFQLVERAEERLGTKLLIPVLSIACTVLLAVVNIPAIMEMLGFAATFFPI